MNRTLETKLSVLNALIATLLAVACLAGGSRSAGALAPDSTPAPTESVVITAADEPISATPRGEQALVLAAQTGAPSTLDPAFAHDIGTTLIVRQIFRGLTRLNDELQPVPELADRIEISPDGLTYMFRLR